MTDEALVWIYPAITACVCAGRRPNRDELRVVAARIWREAFRQRFGAQPRLASFAARRLLLRAARATLAGAVPRRR